jgi:Flp pilus assembly protein TadG
MLQQLNTRLVAAVRRFGALRAVRRLARREDGAAAVEFALVATPFLAFLFAIMETSFIFFAEQTLEKSAADAARLIMTGQQQNATVPEGSTSFDEFKKKVCDPAAKLPMFDCAKMIIDVQTYGFTSFSSANTSKPINNGKLNPDFNAGYNPGGPGCIVVVRIMYPWPVYVSLLGLSASLSEMAGNQRLLLATAVFRNEPYGNQTSC